MSSKGFILPVFAPTADLFDVFRKATLRGKFQNAASIRLTLKFIYRGLCGPRDNPSLWI